MSHDDCPFCEILGSNEGFESATAIEFPDAFPLAEGHMLVVPCRHVASIFDLTPDEQADVWQLVAAVRQDLIDELKPDGFTIGVNDGSAAGQTVEHAHVHIIPRRKGDVADARGGVRWVIPDKAAYWEPNS
jgi:diadenosine tetraphosphate (Ap4A) HIT family hydrolase